jgi:hypothetical protein
MSEDPKKINITGTNNKYQIKGYNNQQPQQNQYNNTCVRILLAFGK